ncbi:ATP-binding cassette domain-containing protein [Actinacidiphila sp. DG2A-62]|jgi:iron complex transport system ATP-binding protein|uniref:ABC transporter ATP-binding protein n=1 Tax=Actinacidiphila sp. DG2A-62 TaxID=3108821 RepID=UPI002DB762FC|nr:ATP-binding cassette domain-containing protein [Actinacidiphila sp. DG2A-62]MEC3994667.1 ATP-binding cassette domain-containing protein [Actinacidiphila sp. DG2A-62]
MAATGTGAPGADSTHGSDGARGASPVVAALHAASVRRYTTGQVILDDVTWSVRSGEHWALLGPNGAGKTTALRLIGALMHPTTGSVEVLGHRLGSVDMRELRARIGLVSSAQKVPQDATAHTVVLTGHTGTVQPLWRKYDAEVRERAHALLAELEIKELAERPYGVCSGGQRARILVARALMADPSLLLLDEPFNALDLPSREDLIDAMHRLALTRANLATITVTHHLEELSPAIGHVLLLKDGRVLTSGRAQEVLTAAHLTECFGRPIEVGNHQGRWLARSGRG